MIINVYGKVPSGLWAASYTEGANLLFSGGETYRVTVYAGGHKVVETYQHRSVREWVKCLNGLRYRRGV